MLKNDEKKLQSFLLPLDLISVALSLFIAIFLRFHKSPGLAQIARSYDGLYYMIFGLVLIIYVAVFFIFDSGHKPLVEQDPFEKTVIVIKNQLMMLICLICLLYLIRVGYWASRAVVLMFFFFGILTDTFVRFAYGRYLREKLRKKYHPVNYLLITGGEDREKPLEMAKKILPEKDSITSVLTADELKNNRTGIYKDRLRQGTVYDEILIFSSLGTDAESSKVIMDFVKTCGIPSRRIIMKDGVFAGSEMLKIMRGVPVLRQSGMGERCPVLGVDFTVTNLPEALAYIRENIVILKGKYICFGNVHTTVMAHENEEYRNIQNNSAFVMPDGMPILKEQKRQGHGDACRVAGPDFMGKTFISAMDGKLSMYFYGSTPETIEALKENLTKRYPGIDIRGFESPPFRELTEEEDREAVERINASGADLVWVGLGAPKQEKWMAEHAGRINSLMLGVGAGFDFHAGTLKRAPFWIQKIGMEWLYRLFQDPKRLLKRYVITNLKFIIYSKTAKIPH